MQLNNIITRKGQTLQYLLVVAFLCLLGALPASAQQRLVTGTVYEGDNEPLIGATVKVKGTSRGTITDFDGRFEIQATAKEVLQVSYVGYKTIEVPAANTNINIQLQPDDDVLDEVVVVGTAHRRKPPSPVLSHRSTTRNSQ